MKPKTLSASSLKTATGCLARFYAENIEYGRGVDNQPALVGTAVHGAFERFVVAVYFDKSEKWEWLTLVDFYDESYQDTFNTADKDSDNYRDGLDLCKRWFDRTDLSEVEVLSCEVKENFPVKTSIGDIPVTYIWDRCDKLNETTVKVVDYKSIRVPVTADDLKNMIQPRLYALSAQLKFPWAEKVWVEFDLLRHERVGIVFTKEQNRATYYWIKAEAERILAADESDLSELETLNPDCRYCIRKGVCEKMKAHAAVGGVQGLPIIEIAKRKLEIDSQLEGLKWLAEELDEQLLKYAADADSLEFTVLDEDNNHDELFVTIKGKMTRTVDEDAVREIIGNDLAGKYAKIGVTVLDKLLKGEDLSDEKKTELRKLVNKTWGSPKAVVKRRDMP